MLVKYTTYISLESSICYATYDIIIMYNYRSYVSAYILPMGFDCILPELPILIFYLGICILANGYVLF